MAVRKILVYPEYKSELRQKSEAVNLNAHQLKQIIEDLQDTLQASGDGIGLAAPQIIHQRVVIVCLGAEVDGIWQAGPPQALINPQIVEMSDERKDFDGCLSFRVYMEKQCAPITCALLRHE